MRTKFLEERLYLLHVLGVTLKGKGSGALKQQRCARKNKREQRKRKEERKGEGKQRKQEEEKEEEKVRERMDNE